MYSVLKMEWNDIEKLLNKIWEGKKFADDIEGEFLDFKSCPEKLGELVRIARKMAVCFANAGGGNVVFGVENKIKGPDAFTGCLPNFEVWKISKLVSEGTKRPVYPNIVYHTYRGIELIEMKVKQGLYRGAHALTDGSQYERLGAECIPMYPGVETPKFVQAEKLDYSRSILENITFDDLDKREITRLRDAIRLSESASDFLTKNDEDLLKSLGMIKDDKSGSIKFTVASLLFVGNHDTIHENTPQSELVFQAFDENDREIEEKRYSEGLVSMVLDLQEYYKKMYNRIYRVDTGLFEIKIPKIPELVLREALLNAVTHREYLIPSAIFFKNYENRIEITNPGDFLGDITPNNILTHSPIWRNRLIAEIFQRMGLVKRSGIGIDRMYEHLLNVGKEPPYFRDEHQEVTLTIYDNIDEDFAKYLHRLKKEGKLLPLDEMLILSKLKGREKITTNEASKIIQRPIEDARKLLDRMHNNRQLDRHGGGRGTYYRLSNKIYNELGNSLGYVRNGGIEKSKQKEMILRYLSKNYKITNNETQNLLATDSNHVYRVLKELREEGKIVMYGKGKGAYYQMKDYKFDLQSNE